MSPQVQSPFMPNHKSPQVQQQTLPSPHFHHQPSPMQHQTSPLYPHPSPQAPTNQVQSAAYVSPSSAEGPKKVLEELLQGMNTFFFGWNIISSNCLYFSRISCTSSDS